MKKATRTMKKRKSGSKEGKGGASPSQLIDARIKELSDWRDNGGDPLDRALVGGSALTNGMVLLITLPSRLTEFWL
jgi:hypothetical protein